MRIDSLYIKLTGVLVGLLSLAGAGFILVILYSTEMYQQEVNQKLNHDVARLLVAEKIFMQGKQVNREALEEIFDMMMVINPSIEVYLLDPEGTIMAYSADPGKVKRRQVAVAPIRRFLRNGDKLPIRGEDPRDRDDKKVFTAARIPPSGELEGYLYVILGGEVYDSIIHKLGKSHIFRLTASFVIAIIAVVTGMGLIFFALLTRRLTRLSSAMDGFTRGRSLAGLDLPQEKPQDRGDEIDRLMTDFRLMAHRIENQVQSLKNIDQQRRDLVANISHDLRTPLATLQGYLETLAMKDKRLSPDERHEYVQIAISHCSRLKKLISELFELARLEAHDARIQPEPVNLAELVQDVLLKFRLAAVKKKVELLVTASRSLPLVQADIALMERVFENLIANALEHSEACGKVQVKLQHRKREVLVEVTDSGPGIPEDQLPYIFDRYFQSHRSRQDQSDHHDGLGLAISKQILGLHGAAIDVATETGKGTTFSFSLPAEKTAGV